MRIYFSLDSNISVKVEGELFIIAYVHTAIDHYKRRMIIRQTWGKAENYDVNVRVVFVMGAKPTGGGAKGGGGGVKGGANEGNGSAIQQALLFEAEQYGDMVQVR